MSELVLRSDREGLATLSLNRPDKLNALTVPMFLELRAHVERIATIGGTLCVNPGSPTYPHNYDTQFGTIGFLELDNGKADASVWQLTEAGIEPFAWNEIPPWKRRR